MKGGSEAALSLIDRFLNLCRRLLARSRDFQQSRPTPELAATDHIFRHIKKSWIDGDFIEPAAFRLRLHEDEHKSEKGLSVNWVEYFKKANPRDAIGPLIEILSKKRDIRKTSIFAMLNIRQAKNAAAKYVPVAVIPKPENLDASHAEIVGFREYNDQVAEELAKVIVAKFPAKP